MNHADVDDLLSRLKETQELLQFPGVDGHFERAERLLVSIARHAPSPAVAQAAMNAITLASLRRDPVPVNADANNVDRVLSHLRAALEEFRSSGA